MKIESMIKDKVKDLQMQRNSSNDCLETTTKGILEKKYGDRAAFLVLFNPDNQYRYTREIDRCFFGSGPTLFEVGIMYGDNTPILWLVAQLINLSEYCGLKEKATTMQLEECARTIYSAFYFLKITELMYFFVRFKSGIYGRFYSFFDPQFINVALHEFLSERNERYAKHEEQVLANQAKSKQAGAISYPEYLKLKNKKQNEAKQSINKP